MVPSSDDTRHAERPLGQVAARGARLALLGWGASQGLTFVAYIVLAHLLTPHAFGTFAAGSILIAFGILFAESGTMMKDYRQAWVEAKVKPGETTDIGDLRFKKD